MAFTLDAKRQNAVFTAFERLYEAGLIYYGEYLVNWDSKGQTTVSDEEIVYEPSQGTLYTFRYSKEFPLAVATTRPETKLGDVAVAVHPDGKWKRYIGKKFEIGDFVGVKLNLEIVGDETVNPEFGTGAVGVTPKHSKEDWEIAQRHGLLPKAKQIINEFDKMIHTTNDLNGKGIKETKVIVVDWLKAKGLLEKEETIEHNLAKAQRSGGTIAVLPKRHQFFVNVNKPIPKRGNKTLKDLMRDAVASGKIKIIPERFEKIYFHWIDNLRDWNISRQVWYGHKIPAWYREDEIRVNKASPGADWQPITDTFDTWFSSGLWTFSTLGWPEQTSDLKTFHPTDVLETGYDILFFWVARMILMSTFLLDEIPFKKVFLHGLIRDAEKKKMSKSKGNVIDPLDMTKQYGTDALRFALVFNTAPGTDMALAEAKIKGMKHFANKLWNIARFILSNTVIARSAADEAILSQEKIASDALAMTEADKDILFKLKALTQSTTEHLENFRLHEAAQENYQFVWHEFADIYIEASKKQLADEKLKNNTLITLHYSLITILKLLHPFMPFITEEIWGKLGQKELLMISSWPK
jgi:valyl-tRNA synthetase